VIKLHAVKEFIEDARNLMEEVQDKILEVNLMKKEEIMLFKL
jgi:hypothetical protein